MFRKVNGSKNNFDEYIQGLLNEIVLYESAWAQVNPFMAPEIPVDILDKEGEIIDRATVGSLKKSLQAHRQRVDTLKKMAKGKAVSEEEHALLLLMPVLKKDQRIVNYSKVNKTGSRSVCSVS